MVDFPKNVFLLLRQVIRCLPIKTRIKQRTSIEIGQRSAMAECWIVWYDFTVVIEPCIRDQSTNFLRAG